MKEIESNWKLKTIHTLLKAFFWPELSHDKPVEQALEQIWPLEKQLFRRPFLRGRIKIKIIHLLV